MVRDPETNARCCGAMGQVHIEVAIEKLKRKFEVDVHSSCRTPPTTRPSPPKAKAQGKYKRQSGGRRAVRRLPHRAGAAARGVRGPVRGRDSCGAYPRNFIPVGGARHPRRGEAGPARWFPLVDFKVPLVDGSFHTVDSSDMAFRIAGSMALKNASPPRGRSCSNR